HGHSRNASERNDQHSVCDATASDGERCCKQCGERGSGDVHGAGEWSEWDVSRRGEHGDDEWERGSDIGGVHGERDGGWAVYGGGNGNWGSHASKLCADEHGGASGEGGGDERVGAERGDQHSFRSAVSGDGDG